MSYLDLNNDAKSIVAKRLSNDVRILLQCYYMNITTMFTSKHYDFQKILFGEIVFDETYSKTKQNLVVYICICM